MEMNPFKQDKRRDKSNPKGSYKKELRAGTASSTLLNAPSAKKLFSQDLKLNYVKWSEPVQDGANRQSQKQNLQGQNTPCISRNVEDDSGAIFIAESGIYCIDFIHFTHLHTNSKAQPQDVIML